MRAVNARFLRNRISEFGHAGSWFSREHVEPGPNALRMNRGHQSVLIDNFAARSINEVSAFLHCFEELGTDQRARVRLQRHMNADDIGYLRDVEWRIFSFNA